MVQLYPEKYLLNGGIAAPEDFGNALGWFSVEGVLSYGYQDPMSGVISYYDSPNGVLLDPQPAPQDVEPFCCPEDTQQTLVFDMAGGGAFPTAFEQTAAFVFIDVVNMTGDLDLTAWLPLSAAQNVTFTIRKFDTTPNKIIWGAYGYVDQKLETLTLIWDGLAGTLNFN